MNPPPAKNSDPLEVRFHLATAWAKRGRTEQAIAGYLEVLEADPEFVPARLKLGELMLELGRTAEALDYYAGALKLRPGDEAIRFRFQALEREIARGAARQEQALSSGPRSAVELFDHPDGKLNLTRQKTFPFHRSGWNYALHALVPLHHRAGVLFDGFIENNFAWKHWSETERAPEILEQLKRAGTFERLATSQEQGITPYRVPWVGFLHNPPRMPDWFHRRESPQTIFAKAIWKESAAHCRGLFTTSEYLAAWVRQQTGLPVSAQIHPTEIPEVRFDFEKFIANQNKKIVQVGWWLRKLSAIYQLPLPRGNPLGYEKVRLVPLFFERANAYLSELMQTERAELGLTPEARSAENTRELLNVSDAEYDRLLSENLVFIELYDASSNNTVVECIARSTPLLVNPLPAVVEYLGADYPFYFDSFQEAADKALDPDLVWATHRYLLRCETRAKLDAAYFCAGVSSSQVYRSL